MSTGLKNIISIRNRIYQLPKDNFSKEVLVPCFSAASNVRGAFGWFSSEFLGEVAEGLTVFIEKNIENKNSIELLISPMLFESDRKMLTGVSECCQWAFDRIQIALNKAHSPTAGALENYATECLGWLVKEGILNLKIAVPHADSNFHPKVWVFSDGMDSVVARGSANATGRALSTAVEHMDVNCSWKDSDRVNQTKEMVDCWFKGQTIEKVVDLPEALRLQLIELAPTIKPSRSAYEKIIKPITASRATLVVPETLLWETGIFKHQGEAVKAWENAERCGLLEMATGSGKTKTALIAASRLHNDMQSPLLVVISAPTNILVSQWEIEVLNFKGVPRMVSKASSNARKQLYQIIFGKIGRGNCVEVLITTNNHFKSKPFIDTLVDLKLKNPTLKVLHIADESHSLGAEGCIEVLDRADDLFTYRLGLSATPIRQYDEEGTDRILSYFKKVVYEFGLDKAIGVCLVPYDYFFDIAYLDSDEVGEFLILSKKISRLAASSSIDNDIQSNETLKTLLIRRRKISECAASKIVVLREIMDKYGRSHIPTLIYVSSKDPSQMESVLALLNELDISVSRITEHETANPIELARRIEAFKNGAVDILIAKKVLDEGVDIPCIKQAVFLASTSVEREWIQRRGRILRLAPDKAFATIRDILALPSPDVSGASEESVRRFIYNELSRIRAFAKYARNAGDVLLKISEIQTMFRIGVINES